MKIVDVQMALQRPPELAADKAREMQRSGLNLTMANEIDKFTQEDKARIHRTNQSESGKLHLHEDGKNRGGEEEKEEKDKKNQSESGKSEGSVSARQYASARILNLTVDNEKIPKDDRPKFDIKC